MTFQMAALQRATASGGALALLGSGLLLYQLTTLALGPQGSRQLPLSISLPAVDGQESTDPIPARPSLLLGSLLTAVPSGAVSRPATATAVMHHAVGSPVRPAAATTPAAQVAAVVTPAPAPRPQPTPAVKPTIPLPADRDAHDGELTVRAAGAHRQESRDRD